MNWRVWLYGLLSAVIGGVSTTAIVTFVDPQILDEPSKPIKILLLTGIVNAAHYLKQSPLPRLPQPPEPQQQQ